MAQRCSNAGGDIQRAVTQYFKQQKASVLWWAPCIICTASLDISDAEQVHGSRLALADIMMAGQQNQPAKLGDVVHVVCLVAIYVSSVSVAI